MFMVFTRNMAYGEFFVTVSVYRKMCQKLILAQNNHVLILSLGTTFASTSFSALPARQVVVSPHGQLAKMRGSKNLTMQQLIE